MFWYTGFVRKKILKIPSEVEPDATYVPMGLNRKSQEPVQTKDNKVHDDQPATAPSQIHFSPVSPNDHSTLYRTSKSSTCDYN